MRKLSLFVAAFIVATSAFWVIMLTDPPKTEAAGQSGAVFSVDDIAIPKDLPTAEPADAF
jgi:hypothetical protein